MKAWSRDEVVSELAPRLWDYLVSHAKHVDSYLELDSLLGLDAGEIQRLAAIKVMNPKYVWPVMVSIEAQLRSLRSTAKREVKDLHSGIRGRVDWPATRRLRITTSDQLIVRSSVAERAYDTWTARILRFALESAETLTEIAGLGGSGELAIALAEMREVTARMSHHAKLKQARRIDAVPAEQIERFRSRTGLEDVARFVDDCQYVLAMTDPVALKGLLGRSVLAPVSDDKLYELVVGFKLIDALTAAGYQEKVTHIRGLSGLPFAAFADEQGAQVLIWRETSPFEVGDGKGTDSHFATNLRRAGLSVSSLRPDFLLEFPGRPCLMVEVKHTVKAGKTRDRDGLRDALAYLKDCEGIAPAFRGPRAMVVAYGSSGAPNPLAEVMICDEDGVLAAVGAVLTVAT